jgi:hypothetical protein
MLYKPWIKRLALGSLMVMIIMMMMIMIDDEVYLYKLRTSGVTNQPKDIIT